MAHGQHISLPKTFSSGDVNEWFKRFDICSKANGWNSETKAKKLPTLLEGEALAIWMELSEDEQKDFDDAKKKIAERIVPEVFVTLDEFHKRRLLPGESLSLFVYELKKLLDQAMPGMDATAREQLLLHQFLGGVPAPISKQIRAAGETKALDKAVERARLLMTIEREQIATAAVTEVQELKDQISQLTEQVAVLTTARNVPKHDTVTNKRCFNCRGFGHLQ